MKIKNESEFWVKLLQIAKDFGEKGFKISDKKISKFIKENGIDLNNFEKLVNGLWFNQEFISIDENDEEEELTEEKRKKLRNTKFIITMKGQLALLEYEQLQQAKKAARSAMYIAIVSIIISTAGFFYNALFPVETILIEDRTKAQVEETVEKQEVIPLEGVKDSIATNK